jgi:peptidoglycan LD-endopeptidase CwlK
MLNNFRFSKRSEGNLIGVKRDLVHLARLSIRLSTVDFIVIEGKRSYQRQKYLLSKNKTTTMNSRHLTGHAIDVAAFVDGSVSWNFEDYKKIAEAFFLASEILKIPVEWGGNWKTFVDGPHFQLPWKDYPIDNNG